MRIKGHNQRYRIGKIIKIPGLARVDWLWLGLSILITAFALWGTEKIPFHPDESTYLFMSQDFETLLSQPLSLAWEPDQIGDLRTHYRMIDAPLTRYLLGIGRSVARLPAPQSDWDWSATWEENETSGALPDPTLLRIGRITTTLLIPFDLLLIYVIGKRLMNPFTGLLACALFGINALMLLHGRRAMAEGILVFGALFCLWSSLHGDRKPWLVGLTLALAINAKQTCVVLIPVGLISVSFPDGQTIHENRILSIGKKWAQITIIILLFTFLLNPFLWKHPFQASQAAWLERLDLLNRQINDYAKTSSGLLRGGFSDRIATVIIHLFISAPSFSETSNYSIQTFPLEKAYLAIPGHNLLRGMTAGGIMIVLALAGIMIGILGLHRETLVKKKVILLLLLSTIMLGFAAYSLMLLPWQRYVAPLVPLVSLWTAYCLTCFCQTMENRKRTT